MSADERRQEVMDKILKGTTTLGVVCKDGVILATDRRATAGFHIAHKHTKKTLKVDDHIAATIAGGVADAQMFVEYLGIEARLYRTNNNRPMPVRSAATIAANMLGSRGFYLQSILAGMDGDEPSIYLLDMLGTLTEEKRYICTGSGTPYAVGVLESGYKNGITTQDALPLVVKAITSSIRWDPGTGEGFDVLIIEKDGMHEHRGEELLKTYVPAS